MFIPTAPYSLTHPDLNASEAVTDARDAQNKVEAMRNDIERLLMITDALWIILKEKHDYTDAVLTDRITEIDLRDGQLDGRVAKSPPKPCPFCGKMLVRDRPLCPSAASPCRLIRSRGDFNPACASVVLVPIIPPCSTSN